MQRIFSILVCLVFLTSCGHKKEADQFERKDSFEKISIGQGNQETKIPSELWDRLEQFYAGSGVIVEEKIAEQGSKQQKKIEVPVVFMPVKVYLTEKTNGALGGQNYQINFDLGGGILDLKNFVKKDHRSFYLAIDLEEKVDAGSIKVFFVSNSKELPIKKDVYGAGCGKYMDVTSFYQRVIANAGIELNTAGARYIHVVGGTFVIAIVKNSSLYLSQVTILDSRLKKHMCRI